MSTANDLLMSGGGKFAKFIEPGDTITGEITNIGEPYQVREYNQATQRADGPPKFTKAGKPVMAFHVTLATTDRDPSNGEDDGTRVVDVNSWRMQDAIRNACRAAGANRGLDLGGSLTVTYVGDEVPGDPRSGKKYTATYTGAANTALMGATAAPAPAAATAAPAPAAAAPAAQAAAPAAASNAAQQDAAYQAWLNSQQTA